MIEPQRARPTEQASGRCGAVTVAVKRGVSKYFAYLSPSAAAMLLLSSAAQYYASSVLSLAMYLTLDYSPQESTLYWMYLSWLYWASPVVGWLSDWFTCFGQRRKPAIVMGLLLSVAAWTLLCWGTNDNMDYAIFVAVSLVATFGQMLITIPLNGIVVETATAAAEQANARAAVAATGIAQSEPLLTVESSSSSDGSPRQINATAIGNEADPTDAVDVGGAQAIVGVVQSHAMMFKTVGSLFGAVLQTVVQVWFAAPQALYAAPVLFALQVPVLLLLRYDPQTAAQKHYAAATLGERFRGAASALKASVDSLINECKRTASTHPVYQGSHQRAFLRRLDAIRQAPIVALSSVLTFVFIYNATPDGSVMYSQYLATEFEFAEWFLSFNNAVSLVGSVIGCEVYARFVAKRDQFRMFALGCLAAALCYVTRVMLATGFALETLRIPADVFVVVDGFIVAVLTRIAFMPVLHVASSRAPAGFEALIFELFSVAAIGGSSVASITAAQMATSMGVSSDSWGRFWELLLACAVSKLVPLFASIMLPPVATPALADAAAV
jgi:hypothetical protein